MHYTWNPGNLPYAPLDMISGSLTALACLTIALALIYIVRKREDLRFEWRLACLGALIFTCGAAHVIEAWTPWAPIYWVLGITKAITAAISVAAAAILVKRIPRFLAIPSPRVLREENSALLEKVAEGRRAEREHRASEGRVRLVMQSVGDAIISCGSDETIIFWNDAAEKTFGYRENEALGQSFDMLMPERFREIYRAELQDLQVDGGTRRLSGTIDFMGLAKDGREFPIDFAVSAWQTGEGIFYTGVIRDITERKRSEEALKESEERFYGAFEGAPIGVALVSPEGNWLRVNRAFCDLVGYTEPELMTRTFHDITHPDDLEADLANVAELLAGHKRSYKMEKRYTHGRGHFVTVWLSVSLVRDGAGKPRYIIAQVQDITERKRAEAELEAVHQQLLVASRLGGMAEIATNVLHNVGNVLNSVNVSAGLVATSVKRPSAARLQRVVDLMREHEGDLADFMVNDARGKNLTTYLANLSEQLLADQKATIQELNSLEANIEHIKEIVAMQQSYATASGVKEIININELVEDSLRMNEVSLNHHRVEVVHESEQVPCTNVEKHKILQILVNLIRNAKQSCQESSRPDKQLKVRVANGEGRIKISVMDNGVGIPPENMTRVFSHGFTTRKDGHGFGLHSGALTAKEMGGSLTVQSDGAGQGATFTLELPVGASKSFNQ